MKKREYPGLRGAVTVISIIFITTAGTARLKWTELALLSTHGNIYLATSELNDKGPYKFGPYGAHNLFDNNRKTCWAEGIKGHGTGQSLYIAVKEGCKSISIINGYTKSRALFQKNSRVRKLRVSLFIGINEPGHVTETHTIYNSVKYKRKKEIALKDTDRAQAIDFPFKWDRLKNFKKECLDRFVKMKKPSYDLKDLDVQYILNLEILDVYKGSKYDDTCISEISFAGPEESIDSIKSIYLNKDENAIICKTAGGKEKTLASDKNSTFQILEISPDKKWVIVIKMAAHVMRSRVETEYLLINTGTEKVFPPSAIAGDAGDLTGFVMKKGKLHIRYTHYKTFREKTKPVTDLFD